MGEMSLLSTTACTPQSTGAEAQRVCLGIVRLDEYPFLQEGGEYDPAPGDVDYPGSFPYPSQFAIAKHCTFERLCAPDTWRYDLDLKGRMEDGLRRAIEELDQAGCTVITSDCGFFAWMQEFGQSCTRKPVALSSLVYLPSLFHVVGRDDYIAIFTANGNSMQKLKESPWMQELSCGQAHRLVVVGCNEDHYGHIKGFKAIARGQTVNVEKVRPGMIQVAKNVMKKHPQVGAILIECTEMPPYSDSIRHATGLPVYDAITVCNTLMAGWLFPPSPVAVANLPEPLTESLVPETAQAR